MNEQILEIADRAYDEYETDTVKYDAKIPDGFCQKFAELLIKQCLDIIEDEGNGEGGSVRAIHNIKRHFGLNK